MFSLKTKTCLTIFLSMSIIVFIACKKNIDSTSPDPVATALNLPETPFNYANPVMPAFLNAPPVVGQINTPPANPITDLGATLGRVLFYDKNLSKNKTVSCASCHVQANSFSDPLRLSRGFAGGSTGRHSMSLIDAKYYPNGRFFWDQRAVTLEDQVLRPIQDLIEMGITLDTLVQRVQSQPFYPVLFTKAFGSSTINTNLISRALSQFVRSIVSYQSKYDAGRSTIPGIQPPPPSAPFSNFTAEENRGKEIFLSPIGGCAPCHGSETFTAPQEKNNGLDLVTVDRGFGAVLNAPGFDGTFKVGSLRNIQLTAPYMHDGRFNTLEEVVEHYNSGVKNHPNLSPQLRALNGQPRLLNLSVADKAALVAFLKTLTDMSVTTDVKYSNPFK
jgi:cytochrome c peroxidase